MNIVECPLAVVSAQEDDAILKVGEAGNYRLDVAVHVNLSRQIEFTS